MVIVADALAVAMFVAVALVIVAAVGVGVGAVAFVVVFAVAVTVAVVTFTVALVVCTRSTVLLPLFSFRLLVFFHTVNVVVAVVVPPFLAGAGSRLDGVLARHRPEAFRTRVSDRYRGSRRVVLTRALHLRRVPLAGGWR
jgi:hypothetical protein